MRFLVTSLLACLPVVAQTPDYGSTALPGAMYDSTLANRTMPFKSGLASATPSTCTASKEFHVKTYATPAQQLFLCNATGNGFVWVGDGGGSYLLPTASGSVGGIKIGAGLTIDAAGGVTSAGGASTINSGAGNGGYRMQLTIFAPVALRGGNPHLTTAAGAAKGIQIGIYNAAMTSMLASATTIVPGTSAAGAVQCLSGGGPTVSSGVSTLPDEVYWIVLPTHSTSMRILTHHSAAGGSKLINATTTPGIPCAQKVAMTGSALVSGTGSGFTLAGGLNAVSWDANTCYSPIFALVN